MRTTDWNKLANYYDMVSKLETDYTVNQINELDISPDDTILDVGCGCGRIAIPAAKRAKSVTALDAYEEMIKMCNENAKREGITNITTKLIDWNNAVIGETVEKHDIVIASRSVGMLNPEKLNEAAKKYAVMIGWVKDDSPSIGSLFKGIQDDSEKFSASKDPIRDYICGYQFAFNKIYDMGARPNVHVVKDGFKRDYRSREAAYDDLRRLCEFPDGKEILFRKNADAFLTDNAEGGVTYCCERWSYVLWWKTLLVTRK